MIITAKTKRYFSKLYYSDKEELKREYRSLSKQFHPDLLGGSNTIMALINAEHDELKDDRYFADAHRWTTPTNKQNTAKKKPRTASKTAGKRDILQMLKDLELEYEIDGKHIIVESGNGAYQAKDTLKKYGFWWDTYNKHWYWEKAHSKAV